MGSPPPYFERIRAESERRWLQLEADPQLAGPWRQLFRQITSTPAHVLSELLQNADDAGATHVAIVLSESDLEVRHNGRDFRESDFEALCGFGTSNKASLHTIGFRGIGFKSTFAVGPKVFVLTPTLSVAFHAHRFTLPEWVSEPEQGSRPDQTVISVGFQSSGLRMRLAEYLSEWSAVPLSLLFFRNVRTLEVNGQTTGFRSRGEGPVAQSEWFSRLTGDDHLLLIRSEPAHLPDEAIEEVRTERGDPELNLPPVEVQLVLGGTTEGRLHVVLPSGVRATVPFASNAPFIQDPARLSLKDPLLSPTNRWLLSRVGQLAASSMLAWLTRADLPPIQRAEAYGLLPRSRAATDPQSTVIIGAMEVALRGSSIVLGADGNLHAGHAVVIALGRVREVWPDGVLAEVLEGVEGVVQHRAVQDNVAQVLAEWCGKEPIVEERLLERLARGPAVPRPSSDQGMRALWRILDDHWSTLRHNRERIQCVPAVGTQHLHRPREVIRLGAIEAALDPTWIQFLTTSAPLVDLSFLIDADADEAKAFLARIGLDRQVGLPELLHKVAGILHARADRDKMLRACQIAGLANVKLEPSFPLITQDGGVQLLRDRPLGFAVDEVEELVPPGWARKFRITDDYLVGLSSEEARQWIKWMEGDRSGLGRFPLPSSVTNRVLQDDAKSRIVEAGGEWPARLPLRYGTFDVDDYDFDAVLVNHWENLAEGDHRLWSLLTRELVTTGWQKLEGMREAAVYNVSSRRRHLLGYCRAAWLARLRRLRCVISDRGEAEFPSAVLLSGARTEPLRGVVPFLAEEWDTPSARGLLLQLGVQTDPTDVEGLIDRLRSLSTRGSFELGAATALFRALSLVWPRLAPEQRDAVRRAMRTEPLIPSAGEQWLPVGGLARNNPLQLPAVEVLHPSLGECSFLDHCGLPAQPGREHVIAWVRARSNAGPLSDAECEHLPRALSYLGREAARETGYWLSASREMCPIDALEYIHGPADSGLLLFPFVARRVALRCGNPEADQGLLELGSFRDLEASITRRAVGEVVSRKSQTPEWLRTLQHGLGQFLGDQPNVQDADAIGRMCATTWHIADDLLVELWDGSTHLGPAQPATALWDGDVLIVVGNTFACEAGLRIELARAFSSGPLQQIVTEAIGRSSEYVADLMAMHLPRVEVALAGGGERGRPRVPASESVGSLDLAPSEESTPAAGADGPARSRQAQPLPGQSRSGSVAVLGGGGLTERKGAAKAAGSRSPSGWARTARAYLASLGFVMQDRHPRSEDWRHEDGRRAELRAKPIHIRLFDISGDIEQLVQVVPRSARHGKAFPLYHETWVTMGEASARSCFLVADDSTYRVVGFSEVTTGGRTYPAAYMVQLPELDG